MRLGLDLGTSKVAAILCNDDGSVVSSVSDEHHSGGAEQSAESLLECAWDVVNQLPSELRQQVNAIGLTGQMHGVVVLDADLQPLTPLVTWQDQRCLADESFLPRLRERSGYPFATGYGLATLAWLVEHHELPVRASATATIHDLAVARLTGARPLTDPTDAASWGAFDLAASHWDLAAVEALGVPAELLPEILPSGTVCGVLTDPMAARLGLLPGLPVTVAIGDNQASLLATLWEPEAELALTLGTGGQLSAVVAEGPTNVPPTCDVRPFPGGRYLLVAASLCGGSAWAWLVERLEGWLAELGVPCPARPELYERLNVLGLASETALEVHPHFLGERHDPTLRGSILGLDSSNATLGALARGLARGIVSNLRSMLPTTACEGRTVVVASGNALRRNELLRTMASEVLELPLRLTDGVEEAATGAALNAGT